MKVFRDLTVTALPEEIKENEGVKYALLRNDRITKNVEIIKLNQQLKEIDENLNIGNYVSVILEIIKDGQLDGEKKEYISKILKKCNYDLLDRLVRLT